MNLNGLSDDYGYSDAMNMLLSLGHKMEQPTPPAMSMPLPQVEHENKTQVKSRKRSRSEDQDDQQQPSPKRARLAQPKRAVPCDDKDEQSIQSSCTCRAQEAHKQWEAIRQRENSAIYKVVPNYPDAHGTLPPGSRRKAVNMIYMMAACLNLEIGTPSMAVLLFDRLMSAVKRPLPRDEIMLTAAVCLNICGKLADIDRSYCGSRGVIQMVRDMVPQNIRQHSERDFAAFMAECERDILQCLDSSILELPTALQCIAEVTNWHVFNYMLWLHSSLLCDVLTADTASTNFAQHEIAAAVINMLCGRKSNSTVCQAIERAVIMFISSRKEKTFAMDPYFGVRMRHAQNPNIALWSNKM